MTHHHLAVQGLDREAQVDALARDREVGVGHDHAEQQQAVGLLDRLRHLAVAGQPQVGAEQRDVLRREQAAPHEARDHGDRQAPGQLGYARLQIEAAHLHAHHQHRARALRRRCSNSSAHAARACASGTGSAVIGTFVAGTLRHVPRDFEIDRPRMAQRGVEHARDLRGRLARVVQPGLVHGELLEHAPLRIQRLHLVVQLVAARGFVRGRRARQHDQRHPLGVGAGHGVHEVEGAGAIGDRGHAEAAAHARGRVGREADRRFVRKRVERQDPAALDFAEQGQGEVAGDAEHFGRAAALQGLEEALGQVHPPELRGGESAGP